MKIIVICKSRLWRGLLCAGLTPSSLQVGVEWHVSEIVEVEDLEDVPADASQNPLQGTGTTRIVALYRCDDPSPETLARTAALLTRNPGLRLVLVRAAHRAPEDYVPMLPLARAVITETMSVEALIGAIHVVNAGFSLVAPISDTPASNGALNSGDDFDDLDDGEGEGDFFSAGATGHPTFRQPLSHREEAIMARLISGASNKDIANDLDIAEATVKVHLRSCYRKIGARNRTQAALWATRHHRLGQDPGPG